MRASHPLIAMLKICQSEILSSHKVNVSERGDGDGPVSSLLCGRVLLKLHTLSGLSVSIWSLTLFTWVVEC